MSYQREFLMSYQLITKLTKFCLYGLIGICIVNISSSFMQINLLNDYFVNDLYSDDTYNALAQRNDSRVALVGGVYFILILSSFVIIGRWFFVSAKINHLSDVDGLKVTPGWAVGWYFIPFANLVMPYRSLKETYQASFLSEDWQSTKIPYDFPIWWATWLIGNMLDSLLFRRWVSLEEEPTFEDLKYISYIDITADIFLIINAFFLLRIVRTISDNQLAPMRTAPAAEVEGSG